MKIRSVLIFCSNYGGKSAAEVNQAQLQGSINLPKQGMTYRHISSQYLIVLFVVLDTLENRKGIREFTSCELVSSSLSLMIDFHKIPLGVFWQGNHKGNWGIFPFASSACRRRADGKALAILLEPPKSRPNRYD